MSLAGPPGFNPDGRDDPRVMNPERHTVPPRSLPDDRECAGSARGRLRARVPQRIQPRTSQRCLAEDRYGLAPAALHLASSV